MTRRRLLWLTIPVVVLVAGLTLGTGPRTTGKIQFRPDGTQITVAQPGTPVSRPFAPDQTTVEECGSRLSCLEQALGNVATIYGPATAWGELDRLIAAGEIDPATCHLSSHFIGSGALLWAKGDLIRVLSEERQNCVGGYLHGVMGQLLIGVSTTDAQALAARVVEICVDTYQWPNKFKMLDCAHGAGHAMMLHTGYNLPLSLRGCTIAFPENSSPSERQESRLTCVNGVFMENFYPSYDVIGAWLDYGDPFAFCRELVADPDWRGYKDGVATSCWIHATYALNRIYLQWGDNDIAGFARACDVLDPIPLSNCYLGLGRELSGRRDPALIANACGLGRSRGGEVACIFYAAFSFTNNLAGLVPDFGSDARSLCERMTRDDTIEACWRSFGHYIAYNAPVIAGRTERERCLDLKVPIGKPLDFCEESARRVFYAQGIPAEDLP